MIRTLLTTTALTVLLTAGAIAQETPVTPTPPAVEAPAEPTPPAAPVEPMAPATPAAPAAADPTEGGDLDVPAAEDTDVNEPWDMSQGYVAADTDNLGSRLIDQPVYSSTGDDAEEIGNISDLVFDENGQITAVVIGVGGFLGIGEKAVAADFNMLEFTLAADNTERWVLPTTAEALTAAPDFVWKEDEPADANLPADGGAMAPADPALTPAPAAP